MSSRDLRPVLVTGGAGFIGTSLVDHLVRGGFRVRVYDDLSRPGAEANLAWLRRRHGEDVVAIVADVRDRNRIRDAASGVQGIFHLAAQGAIQTSLADPRGDFDVNAAGTVEVLEAARRQELPPPVVYTSTSRVYGDLDDRSMRVEGERWQPDDRALVVTGVDEQRPLCLRTPYACSKGAADQYVLDYAHSFGVPAVVLRLGCVYGPRQIAGEDHGWVAEVLTRAIEDQPITIYGDGRQVRDVLHVDDAVDALLRAWAAIERLRGRAYNVGGGPACTLSLRELVALTGELRGRRASVVYREARPGDQRWYVSDNRTFGDATGWRPRISPRAGVTGLLGWLLDQRTGRPQTLDNLEPIAVERVSG